MIDLNRLQIFRQVVLAGSFSRAATLLHQPKSKISRNIAALERELGVQLIYRTTRQFRLTEAGKELYARALNPLSELNLVLENLQASTDHLTGPLRVTAPEDLGVMLVADVCRAFVEVHPKVQVDLHLSSQVLDLLKESLDVAIRIGKLKDSTLLQKKIGRIRTGLFVNRNLLNQYPDLSRLESLEQVPFIAFSTLTLGKTKLKLSNGKMQKAVRVNTVFTSNSHLVLHSLANQGVGAALLPLFLVNEDLRCGRLVQILPEWSGEPLPIQVVIPHQKEPLPRVKRFMDFAAAQLSPYFV